MAADQKEDRANLRKTALETLAKIVLGNKQKMDVVYVRGTFPLLRHTSHDEFKDLLLPAAQKAMLRNPEVVLGSVAAVLEGLVNLDLSRYVDDLKKPFGANLHAKDDATRADAGAATAALAAQCSDPDAVSRLLDALFAVLGGSEGKLSQNAQKMSLLEAAGKASNNAVTGAALQTVTSAAVVHFVKVI